jgi:glyceraldehyde 3-phosphate dehydrogenase
MPVHSPVRIGINGFGRVGRILARLLQGRGKVILSHINDPAFTPGLAAHLLNFDSVDGHWQHHANATENGITIDGNTISMTQERSIEAVNWGDKADIVVDCSGRLKTAADLAPYLAAGIRKAILSAPVSGAPNLVMGVNDQSYRPEHDHIVSNASCTTNCLAVTAKVLHELFTIKHGFITTIHAMTNDQRLLDEAHEDWRRARAAGVSLIPTTSGFAKTIGSVIPELAGRLNGYAVRAPVNNASLIDCAFLVEKPADAAGVNAAFAQAAAEGPLKSILGVESLPLVSADYRGDTRSAVVDTALTQVLDGNFIKVVAWYDNETAYVTRLGELVQKVASQLDS